MPVGEIVPKFDGKSSKDMNVHSPATGIVFYIVRKPGWRRGYVSETLEQTALLALAEGAEKVENIHGNEQPRIVHFESRPNSLSHCSSVSQ